MPELTRLECPSCGALVEKDKQEFCQFCRALIVRKTPKVERVALKQRKRLKPLDLADLRKILTDQADVQIDALSNPDWLKDVSEAETADILGRCSPACLAQIAEYHPRLSVDLAHDLIRGDIWETATIALAGNPSAPTTVFKLLVKHSSQDVRWRALENPNCPPEILNEFADSIEPQQLLNTFGSKGSLLYLMVSSPDVLARIAQKLLDLNDRGTFALRFLVKNEYVTGDTLSEVTKFVVNAESYRRETTLIPYLAGHPNTPLEALNRLVVLSRDTEVGSDSTIMMEMLHKVLENNPLAAQVDWSPYSAWNRFWYNLFSS